LTMKIRIIKESLGDHFSEPEETESDVDPKELEKEYSPTVKIISAAETISSLINASIIKMVHRTIAHKNQSARKRGEEAIVEELRRIVTLAKEISTEAETLGGETETEAGEEDYQ